MYKALDFLFAPNDRISLSLAEKACNIPAVFRQERLFFRRITRTLRIIPCSCKQTVKTPDAFSCAKNILKFNICKRFCAFYQVRRHIVFLHGTDGSARIRKRNARFFKKECCNAVGFPHAGKNNMLRSDVFIFKSL